ncbi:MAG: PH domain-containing protein [Pseudomonadota bacterium]|nr:PH domain-containing protein [Pseudomonadota bacterium]
MSPRLLHEGLPAALPAGEVLLWSGSPDWRVLARRVFHVRKLAVYFAAIAVFGGVSAADGGAAAAGLAFLKAAGFGAIPLVLAAIYSWMTARGSIYSITNRRVVMHIGLALPVTLNLPFERITSADMRGAADGSGDLSLTLAGSDRFAYAVLWPHARPWCLSPAQPTLRGLADVAQAASTLARALAAVTDRPAPALASVSPSPALAQHASLAA